jgi:hypothetical protein
MDEARRRVADAKRTLGVVAAAAFVTAILLAYVSHPGAPATRTTGSSRSSGGTVTGGSVFDFGSGGSIAPSQGSPPTAQTHVS